jgi:spore germination protein YaaH
LILEVEQTPVSNLLNLYKRLQDMINLYKLERAVIFSKVDTPAETMAWIYPGAPACEALNEISDGRYISFLKPEYYTLSADGRLTFLDEEKFGCNGYSETSIAVIKEHSEHVYVTVSANGTAVQAFFESDWSDQYEVISELKKFVLTQEIEGVEIDFEGFGGWSESSYRNYLGFLNELGKELQSVGKKLMVDVPPISNQVEQEYYYLRYSDIADLPIDYIVVMAYDYQYDHGSGSAISPNQWVIDIVKNAQKYIESERLVIGLPSYGYSGYTNSYDITVTSSQEIANAIESGSAERDNYSYELMYSDDAKTYVWQDQISLDKKRKLIESLGVQYVSVWALGGNIWFST